VLTKAGLELVGPVLDPVEGEVWQWARQRQAKPTRLAGRASAAAGLLLLGLVACEPGSSSGAAPAEALPEAQTAAVANAGEALFAQNCAVCHGTNGKLGLNGAHDLTKSNLNQNGRVYIVTNGLGKMPSFKGQLTPEQIEQVAAYSLTLKQ
jgi:cytochrome c6